MDVQNVAVELIKVKERYRKDLGDIGALQASIESVGLIHPITVTPSWELVCGERRLQVYKKLGMTEIPAQVLDLDALKKLQAEHDENMTHLPMKVSEKTALADNIKKLLNHKHGERRGRPTKGKNIQPSDNGHEDRNSLTNGKTDEKTGVAEIQDARPELSKGEQTREAAAKAAGFDSDHSYRNAKRVQELGCKDLRDAVDDEVVTAFDAASICDSEHDIQAEAVRRVLHGAAKTLKAAVAAIDIERAARDEMDEPVQDCNGVNVPDNLREYYDSTPQFKLIESKAKELRTLLNALDKHPISQTRQRGQLQSYCKTIEGAMETERFGFVCPACEGHDGANCNCCENRRWFKASDIGKVDLKKWRKGK
jgi:hypothetical protein